MTPDLSLLSGFARGVLLSHIRDTCLHSGSWLLSGLRQGLSFGIVLTFLGSLGV